MGMTIDEEIEYLTDFSIYSPYQEAIDKVSTYIEQIQADYENRLKTDLVAMLTELQLEIDEKATELCDNGWWLTYNNLIQQKINALKSESERKDADSN